MSTPQSTPRPPPTTTPRVATDGDDRRSEAFWAAFGDAPIGTRWTDSAAVAWRPAPEPTLA